MRFGNVRGVTLAVRLATAAALSLTAAATTAGAQGFHTIPRLAPAVDLNTGGPYYAPPIPSGHYTGHDIGGKVHGLMGGLTGKLHGLKGGLGGHGMGLGHGGMGHGMGHGGMGHGLLGKLKGHGMGFGHGGGTGHGFGHATTVMPSSQHVMPAPQGPVVMGDPCGDPGCNLGCGLLGKMKGCGSCGGTGCGMCGGLGHLGGKVHGLMGSALGHLGGGHKIKWFTGPGGPVPLTPGYVPYVNPVRSPRDFFAFPPMSESSSGMLPVRASYLPPDPVTSPATVAPAVPQPPAAIMEEEGGEFPAAEVPFQ